MQDGKTPVNLARSKAAFTVQVVQHQNKQVTAIKNIMFNEYNKVM